LMTDSATRFRPPRLSKSVVIIVGGYGSGKSEVAVNLARFLGVEQTEPVTIADLDIVNPYFRSREAAARLAELGVRSIVPSGEKFYAELPIILPEIKGAIENREGKLILDVGGDDVGATVLSSLSGAFVPDEYELLLVLNARRPFTSTVDGCLKMIGQIEAASRLKFTGIISNTHLMTETTASIVLDGYRLAQAVGKKTHLPVVFLSALNEIVQALDAATLDVPVLTLNRLLLKPWEKEKPTSGEG
jgi:hypothetical protein